MIQCTLLIFNKTHMIRKDLSAITHLGAIAAITFVCVVVIVLSVWSVVCERKDWLWAECRMCPITKYLRALTLRYYRVFIRLQNSLFLFAQKYQERKRCRHTLTGQSVGHSTSAVATNYFVLLQQTSNCFCGPWIGGLSVVWLECHDILPYSIRMKRYFHSY